MKFLGRRQKRFFLLKREKLEFIGGVELTLPDRLSGWVIAEADILDEVRLYLGNHLITKAPINLKREDVSVA